MKQLFEEFEEIDNLLKNNFEEQIRAQNFLIATLNLKNELDKIHRQKKEIKNNKSRNMEKLQNMSYWEYQQFKKKLKKERKKKSWDYLVQWEIF